MYPYVTLPDETLVTHSEIIERNGAKAVKVHFERPRDYGFDAVTCYLPSYEWVDGCLEKQGHYSDEEIQKFELFLKSNAHLLFRYADSGGMNIGGVHIA
jgi:hypothetical protein